MCDFLTMDLLLDPKWSAKSQHSPFHIDVPASRSSVSSSRITNKDNNLTQNSEHEAVTYLIWLLRGLEDSNFFMGNTGGQQEFLKSVGKDISEDVLSLFYVYADVLKKLRAFVKRSERDYVGAMKGERLSVHSLFINYLSIFLNTFDSKLDSTMSEIQSNKCRGAIFGVLQLQQRFQRDLRDVSFLGGIFDSAIHSYGAGHHSTEILEFILLDTIFDYFDMIWKTDDRDYGLVVWQTLSLVTERHESAVSRGGQYSEFVEFIRKQTLCSDFQMVTPDDKDILNNFADAVSAITTDLPFSLKKHFEQLDRH